MVHVVPTETEIAEQRLAEVDAATDLAGVAAAMAAAGWLPADRYVVGLDLGQSNDYTALAVIHQKPWPTGTVLPNKRPGWRWEYHLRHLERLPLGASYVDQVAHVRRLQQTAPLRGAALVIDRSGVGRAVGDLFAKAGARPKLLTITGGREVTEDGDQLGVPKIELVSRLTALLHEGRLKIAASLPLADVLRQELQSFQVEFTASGAMTFNARSGRHDDLVLAVAIAAWYAAKNERRGGKPIRPIRW